MGMRARISIELPWYSGQRVGLVPERLGFESRFS